MGANSAILLYDIALNVNRILSIELFTATQALDFKKPLKTSAELQSFVDRYRSCVNFVTEDKIMSSEINTTSEFIDNYKIEDNLFTF
jgi:histidine ammonia-lyase